MSKSVKNTTALVAATPAVDMSQFFAQANEALTEITVGAETLAAQEAHALEVAAELAALEAPVEDQATPDAGQATEDQATEDQASDAPATQRVEGDIKEMIGNVTLEERTKKAADIADAIAQRLAFEASSGRLMGPGKKTSLEKAQKHLATPGAAGLFVAVNIDPAFINRCVTGNDRFNVYALDKIRDLITGVEAGFLQNAINRAVLLSLFNFRDAGVPFTMQALQGAISNQMKVDRAIAKHLVRHTVAPATAPTQSSQMAHALQVMGIVTSNKARGSEVFTLTDTPIVRRLEQVLRKAA